MYAGVAKDYSTASIYDSQVTIFGGISDNEELRFPRPNREL